MAVTVSTQKIVPRPGAQISPSFIVGQSLVSVKHNRSCSGVDPWTEGSVPQGFSREVQVLSFLQKLTQRDREAETSGRLSHRTKLKLPWAPPVCDGRAGSVLSETT